MLLPSALTCDSSHINAPPTRFPRGRALFASPPVSPPPNAQSTIFATCRALQSMLSSPPPQLPTPPMTHAAPPSPFKLRLRSRKSATTENEEEIPSQRIARRRKITKRNPAPPRGINKRRRAFEDDDSREEAADSDNDDSQPVPDAPVGPSTPKRMRLAPEVLPLGLGRSDFHNLDPENQPSDPSNPNDPNTDASQQTESQSSDPDGEHWSSAEDRLLVELVLEKLKLSKSDWQDCARSLGKDRGSVGRRWKSLMVGGEVGLKRTGPRRSRIHGTWR